MKKDPVILKPIAGDVRTRMPIEALMSCSEHKISRDLFLQGFAKVQRRNSQDPKSFYSVAGIHGLPYEPYNSDDEKPNGYCHHGNILFPTWHRPYVALLEMLVYNEADAIVQGYPESEKKKDYQKGLEKLRFPYWDWASPSTLCQGIPSVLFDEYVRVNVLQQLSNDVVEVEITIRNPLRAYTLPVNLGTMESVGDTSNPTQRPYDPDAEITPYTPAGYATVRHPDKNYLSNIDSTNLAIVRSCSLTFRPNISVIFLIDNWDSFSNHSTIQPINKDNKEVYKPHVSIEGVHDTVHDAIGGLGGHMGYPDIAGFDPIFFLHHANVDRLIAIWQACYPDNWIVGRGLNDEKAPLIPFLKNETSYWTSEDVRNIETLKYNYPELEKTRTPEHLRNDMLKYYQPIPDSNIRWKITISVNKNKVGSPFQVRAFIDLPTGSPTPPITSPNFAGHISIFARDSETNCYNCKDNQDAIVNGEIDLTVCMQRLGIVNMQNDPIFIPLPSSTGLDLNERITLVPVLKDNSIISFKNVGFVYAYCWEIDYEDATNPKYTYKGAIKPHNRIF